MRLTSFLTFNLTADSSNQISKQQHNTQDTSLIFGFWKFLLLIARISYNDFHHKTCTNSLYSINFGGAPSGTMEIHGHIGHCRPKSAQTHTILNNNKITEKRKNDKNCHYWRTECWQKYVYQ